MCDAVLRLGLRNEAFVDYVGALVRSDWDMFFPAGSLVSVAALFSRFGQQDTRAWRAAAQRVVMELPVFPVGALSEAVASFSDARVHSRRLNAAAAKEFCRQAASLSSADLARVCRTCVRQPDWYEPEAERHLAAAVAQAVPRRALDLLAEELRSVMEALARWADPRFGLRGPLLEGAVQAVLSNLARHAATLEFAEVEALLGMLGAAPAPPALQRALAVSCRATLGVVAASPEDAAATAAVLHHLSRAGVEDAELYLDGVRACARGLREATPASWLAAARLLALCGRTGVADEA